MVRLFSIYVGGQIGGEDEQAIREIFSHFGQVIDVHFTKANGRTCGFVVRFLQLQAMQRALRRRDGLELNGKKLFVAEAKQRPGKGFMMHNGLGQGARSQWHSCLVKGFLRRAQSSNEDVVARQHLGGLRGHGFDDKKEDQQAVGIESVSCDGHFFHHEDFILEHEEVR